MNELEDRLRSDLTAAVADAAPKPPQRSSIAMTVARRRRRRQATFLSAAAVLAVGLGFVAAQATTGDDDREPAVGSTTVPTSAPTSTTATTGSPTTTTTTTLPAEPPELTLQPTGLGAVGFGDPFDEVVRAVSARLGPPTSDTEVQPWDYCDNATEPCGALYDPGCAAFTVTREVEWDGLTLGFFGEETDGLVFRYLRAVPPTPLETREGARLGAPTEDWQAIYGDAMVIDNDVVGEGEERQTIHNFVVELADGTLGSWPNSVVADGTVPGLRSGDTCAFVD